jgi:hypothetical protein
MVELEQFGWSYHIQMVGLGWFGFRILMELMVELGQFDWSCRSLMVG